MFTLGRGIDIHYPTNRLILILSAVTTVIGIFISGDILTGVKIGGTIFLTWAFGRELDPKREYGAFIGVAFALYSFFVPFTISFMELLLLMLLLRMINQTSGGQPTFLDAGITLGIAIYLSYSFQNPIYVLLTAIGVFLSQAFKADQLFNIILAGLAGASFGYILSLLTTVASFNSPILSIPLFIGLVLLYTLVIYFDQDKKVYDDQENEVDSIRILKSQLFFAGSVLLLVFLSEPEIGQMILYSSAMAGVIIYQLISKVFKIEDK